MRKRLRKKLHPLSPESSEPAIHYVHFHGRAVHGPATYSNCETWIEENRDRLVREHIMNDLEPDTLFEDLWDSEEEGG